MNIRRIKIEDLKRILFLIAYTFLLFKNMFSSVSKYYIVGNVMKITGIIGYIILIFIAVLKLKKISIKKALIYIPLIIIFFIISYKIDNNYLIALALIILCIDTLDFKMFIKYDLVIKVLFVIILFILFKLGMTTNFFLYTQTGKLRSSMGFMHPNSFGLYIFSIYADIIYIRYKKLDFKDFILGILLFLIIIFTSRSRTSSFGIVLLYFLTFISKKIKKTEKLNKNIAIIAPLFFLILVIFLIYKYNSSKLYINLNEFLSMRLYYWRQFYNNYKVNLFGNKVYYVGSYEAFHYNRTPRILDNSYLYIILNYGVFGYIALYYIFIKIINKAYLNKNNVIIIIMLSYFILGFSEVIIFSFYLNVFILYFYECLSDKNTVVRSD